MYEEVVQLQLGAHAASVSRHGARVRSYRVAGHEVLAGRENADLFAYRNALLAPWPNRVTDGRWSWRGEQLQLPLDDPTGVDAALHGLVVHADFDVVSSTESSVALAHDLLPTAGYPFALRVLASYALTDVGLQCSLTAVNTGEVDTPVGLGVHPYVAAHGLVDEVTLTLPARTRLLTDGKWREVGRSPVDQAGPDLRVGRRLGQLELDAGFTDLVRGADGRVEVTFGLPDGAEVVLSAGSTCRWLLVYTGHTLPDSDRRRSLAVEPMTCPPNGLATGEIDVLLPGGSLTLDWGFALR